MERASFEPARSRLVVQATHIAASRSLVVLVSVHVRGIVEYFNAVDELTDLEGEQEVSVCTLAAVLFEIEVQFVLNGVQARLDGLTRRQVSEFT